MKFLPLILLLFSFSYVSGQNKLQVTVKDLETGDLLAGATIMFKGQMAGTVTDSNGYAELNNIPDGKHSFTARFIGYEEETFSLNCPFNQTQPYLIELHPDEEEMEQVIITATRSSRTIDDIPTRIEAISGEELEEKGNMKPGDIRMMLNESTGIQTQQTSATSYNSSIRIQGLDGKYTQILRDGYPLYSGFSGGLGLLQIVPLDLKQVEVIKGASSTLYGGGAIAGLVNLVTKKPYEERELNFLINGTSALGLDVSGFYSQKFKKTGTTIFASFNKGSPYDPADIGFTAIPKFNRITLNPKLFIYINDKTTIDIGINGVTEDRTGGDIRYIEGEGGISHTYFEKNITNRISSQLGLNSATGENGQINFKNSFGYYDRKIEIPDFIFSGSQFSSYSELSLDIKNENLEWITGLNLVTENFEQDKENVINPVDYNHITLGAFIQNTWNASKFLVLETGLRGDYQNEYGFFILPRVSAMFKLQDNLALRIGGGMGYKSPTVFTEDAERIQFRNVLPVDPSNTEAERSIGGNFDINYRTRIGELHFSINNLLFYTRINDPLILTPLQNGFFEYLQTGGYIETKGIESNIKLMYSNFKLFVGYTLADVLQTKDGTTSTFPLVAKYRLNNVLMYEVHEKIKLGFEAYFYSRQKLNDGATGNPFWILGLMAEKIWENFSIFLNFENLTDTRQTRFDNIYTGSITNPVFKDIYAPVDGFVVNGGIKIRL